MSDFKLSTPVAFIIFNRPDTTERVFAEIAKAKPSKLLIVADGARTNKVGEAEKVAATRDIIQRVDWDCEVFTSFSEVNLGCKQRVSSGIDWVFQQVEEAIILEDDCLPDPTFFRFCQEMLERYKNDQRIGMISGDNFQFGRRRNNDSYYFSKYVHIWGWATWRDRWQSSYDVSLKKWPAIRDSDSLEDMIGNKQEATSWANTFERVYNGEIDTWDYQWVFANWIEGRISIMPKNNLISNVGFRVDATHTIESGMFANMPVTHISFPLTHPLGVFRSIQEDKLSQQSFFKKSFKAWLCNKIARCIR